MNFKIIDFDVQTFDFKKFKVTVTLNSVTYHKVIDGKPMSIMLESEFKNKLSNIETEISNVYFSLRCWDGKHQQKMFECLAKIFDIEL